MALDVIPVSRRWQGERAERGQFYASRFLPAAGALVLFLCVPVGLKVIAMAGFLVVKDKFAYLVIHGAVPIKDVYLIVVCKAPDCLRLAGGIGSVHSPVMAVQLSLLVFFQFVGVVVSGEAVRGLVFCQLPAQVFAGDVLGGMAFLFSVHYDIAVAFGGGTGSQIPHGRYP